MSGLRAFSSPDLLPSSKSPAERPDDHSFEGIATNVKLLLKLIQDHNEACTKDVDDRKAQRVAGMMSILDDVKTRIQKSQTSNRKELRRCNTDLRTNAPRDRRANEPITDEKEKLRRQLSASLAARKSLEIMCTSLGKEKEIMASELARKVHELDEMEELINDLKAQNNMLLGKVQAFAAEQEKNNKIKEGETTQGNAAMQERNKMLSEQLLKSLDGYRSLKRKLKDSQEENSKILATMEEIGEEVQAGLVRIHDLKGRTASGKEKAVDINKEISALEEMFECFSMKISKHRQKKNESSKAKTEISVSEAPVIA